MQMSVSRQYWWHVNHLPIITHQEPFMSTLMTSLIRQLSSCRWRFVHYIRMYYVYIRQSLYHSWHGKWTVKHINYRYFITYKRQWQVSDISQSHYENGYTVCDPRRDDRLDTYHRLCHTCMFAWACSLSSGIEKVYFTTTTATTWTVSLWKHAVFTHRYIFMSTIYKRAVLAMWIKSHRHNIYCARHREVKRQNKRQLQSIGMQCEKRHHTCTRTQRRGMQKTIHFHICLQRIIISNHQQDVILKELMRPSRKH